MKKYDVIVVGGGPAGGAVAAPLAEAGRRVMLIEARAFGGVCPLSGCNPKKALMSGAEAVRAASAMLGSGLSGRVSVDWADLMRFKQSFVDPVPAKARKAYGDKGIDTRIGSARLVGPHEVAVDGESFSAPHICLCVGQKPSPLPVPGGEGMPVSDDFLSLKTLPRRIIFIGGGFIAFEFAHIARQAGAEVTLLNRSDRVLRQFDPVLTQELVEASRAAGIDVRLNAPVQGVEQTASGYRIICGERGETALKADMAFNCTGRTAAIDGLGLDAAGVEYGQDGIAVNSRMQSVSNPDIYAVGDVADQGPALTPVATIQGQVAAANILHPNSAQVDYTGIPGVCFTLPPLAGAGLLESDAKQLGLDFTVRETDLAGSFSWKRLNERFGKARILIDEPGDRILGAHILGHNAEEIINLFALVIRQEIPLSRVKETVWAYPTCGYELKYML
ncbi:MAG: NAD(P)/FAD-dependent oxidoreductase [Pseudodesulfovibrio sp.]|uniref:FAD-dependent pyridine nucleotide-disulfide oxidoreductase n=1 Tax=Pseudodesulfovibrio aespoeensis (strain ATCC 700646 / DSM 10631 / Aspo-2) TaxID=643562 RepID=E6VVW4_PSEA9|nr:MULTISPECIES: NAD(P)/FAD-dependent oxidoreductase [Pseudodesulfovibrio]MBU4193255.1 NAD(P)/FAD-dependent oxidoreductase [Pseudomonadota bacterium]ADU62409.1 FAD-dependent pyridine nucleotide-disulfide oxidoreductase [Pseudodesulfovibrio aespoeensis Aspo-2]MBU4244655.1 NAD(P)/FAD-dependent oxidoreductase [Pseudomonadota bacterium]MBU4377794.1 NAD(P)/FAD-dependent oxidoreductase [Pseudomonadota bacterium]MBU4473926.1 NAD(P)/FAD-dependent oxidoreductase [Pseudomonadota bacterium]